jgi:hypothetical protein
MQHQGFTIEREQLIFSELECAAYMVIQHRHLYRTNLPRWFSPAVAEASQWEQPHHHTVTPKSRPNIFNLSLTDRQNLSAL